MLLFWHQTLYWTLSTSFHCHNWGNSHNTKHNSRILLNSHALANQHETMQLTNVALKSQWILVNNWPKHHLNMCVIGRDLRSSIHDMVSWSRTITLPPLHFALVRMPNRIKIYKYYSHYVICNQVTSIMSKSRMTNWQQATRKASERNSVPELQKSTTEFCSMTKRIIWNLEGYTVTDFQPLRKRHKGGTFMNCQI